MSVSVVIGSQWGDEGKGKIVDLLSRDADVVARYNGGPNAGHTVVVNDEEIILHLIPCGILWPQTTCIIGNGTVIDLEVLLSEIELLESQGVECRDRLWISDRAHVIFPYHKYFELQVENSEGRTQIGTTKRGIGPTYADKMERIGIRVGDLRYANRTKERARENFNYKRDIISHVFKIEDDDFSNVESYLGLAEKVQWAIADTSVLLNEAVAKGRNVLLEGAQGALLDVDFGTYPFVTSSNCGSGGACTGLGIGPTKINTVLGVTKAYTTRVGLGPFPAEFTGERGEQLRDLGKEYGATTGRPRRCGWLDLVVVKFAIRVNGIAQLAVTKLDVLDSFEEIKVCVAYEIDGEHYEHFPADLELLQKVTPVYESFPGWLTDTSGVRSYETLPDNARAYLEAIEKFTGTYNAIVSVGPGREQTIIR